MGLPVGRASLKWELYFILRDLGLNPRIRTLPTPLTPANLSDGVRLEQSLGYFLWTNLQMGVVTFGAANTVSLKVGDRNITDGLVGVETVISSAVTGAFNTSPVDWPHAIVCEPGQALNVALSSIPALSGNPVIVGMYLTPTEWEQVPGSFREAGGGGTPSPLMLETSWSTIVLSDAVGRKQEELTIPYDGLLYDITVASATTGTGLPADGEVDWYINNTSMPMNELPLTMEALAVQSNAVQQVMQPISKGDRVLIRQNLPTGHTEPIVYTMRLGKPWDYL